MTSLPPTDGAPRVTPAEDAIPRSPAVPVVSIHPSIDPGVHLVSAAPGTRIENLGPPPTALAMLIRMSPYLLAIAGFILWGETGRVDPQAAAGFVTAFVVATLSARSSGETAAGALARSGAQLARRAFAKKGKTP